MLSGVTRSPYNSNRLSRTRARNRRGPGPGCRCVKRSRCRTRLELAPSNNDTIEAPAFPGTAVIARHAPTQRGAYRNRRQVHHGRDEALRIAAPCLSTCNRTATVLGNRAVVAARDEATAGCKNVLERVSTVRADLQHGPVEADIGIGGGFKVEIVPKCQLTAARCGKEDGG